MSVAPCIRERREQFDLVIIALEEHLSDTGCESEIPVDLERRVRIPQIVVETSVIIHR